MPDTIILRFRDSRADTITEHRQIITKMGYVWWGWWKKDDEPHRTQELEELRQRAKSSRTEIGLFDMSKEDRFFIAGLEGCVYSTKNAIPSPEPGATPEYYRPDSVAAWFKLTGIEHIEKKEFVRKFSGVPAGTGTLFPVWIVDVTKTVALSGIVADSIRLKESTILHISDLHFGDYAYPARPGPGQYPLEDIIERDLGKLGVKVGVLIASGDLTTRADGNRLFNEALPFLRTLSNRLRILPEHVVLVPGNHDIPLRDFNPLNYHHEKVFNSFLREFYGKPSEIMQVRKYDLPDGRRLEIMTMNSVRLRSKEQKEYGYVQWPLYDSLLAQFPETGPETLRMAVLHHHLVPAPREDIPDPSYPEAAVSLTLDAGAIIEGLQAHRFRVALHGHQHVPGVTRIARGRLKDDSFGLAGLTSPLYVIAAGSAGASRLYPEMKDNTYNILTLNNNSLTLHVRRFNSGSQPRSHIKQGLRL